MAPPFGAVFCHPESHIECDECGAPEFFTGGAKLVLLPGADGKLQPTALAAALDAPDHGVHHVRAAAVSLTQASEAGTVYTPDEVRAIADLAHGRGLKVHMDGARFANALAMLGCNPAEASWKAGVDVLCFGASKNGALAAEAVVVFDRDLAKTSPTGASGRGTCFPRCASWPPSSTPTSQATCGSGWPATPTPPPPILAAGLAAIPGASFRIRSRPTRSSSSFPRR